MKKAVKKRAPRAAPAFSRPSSPHFESLKLDQLPRSCRPPQEPPLDLFERPKKKRKVKVWRWEKVFKVSKGDGGLYLEQSIGLLGEDSWQAENGWTKVPSSEREIDVEDE